MYNLCATDNNLINHIWDLNKYTEALKKLLKKRSLSISGTKSELISRLMENDPSGEWLRGNDEESRDWRGNAESISQAGSFRFQTHKVWTRDGWKLNYTEKRKR